MRSADVIPIVLTVDVEPDDREADPATTTDWTGFGPTVESFDELREQATVDTGAPARFSWFLRMDPQVEVVHGDNQWFTQRHRSTIARLEARGDVIGLHTHAFRWDDQLDRWVSDHDDQDWVDQCVIESCAAFEASFGRPPRHFRFGDRFMSDRTLDLLVELGVRFDLTQEPDKLPTASLNPGEVTTGLLPDYRGVPRAPFRPSRSDFRRPARWLGRPLWEVPVTAQRLPGAPADSDSKALNLASPSAAFQAVMEQVLAGPDPHLVMVSRTNMTTDSRFRPRFLETLDYLMAHPRRHRFRFVTPDELVRWSKRRRRTLRWGTPADHRRLVTSG
ncbi:MAG: hypothetical protein ACR2QE_03365 [Acidimicrobiales bacterium]